MKYVLDSCVGIKWLLAEPDSDKALSLRDGYVQGIHDLIAPDIYPIEVAHAITRAERRSRITAAEGQIHLRTSLLTAPGLHPGLSLLARAFEISSATRQGVYDCLYVALAEREGCPLVTADRKLVGNLGPIFSFIRPIESLP